MCAGGSGVVERACGEESEGACPYGTLSKLQKALLQWDTSLSTAEKLKIYWHLCKYKLLH